MSTVVAHAKTGSWDGRTYTDETGEYHLWRWPSGKCTIFVKDSLDAMITAGVPLRTRLRGTFTAARCDAFAERLRLDGVQLV